MHAVRVFPDVVRYKLPSMSQCEQCTRTMLTFKVLSFILSYLYLINIADDILSHVLYMYITDQMHNTNSYVRDFYFFRRNFYPQLSLIKVCKFMQILTCQEAYYLYNSDYSHFVRIRHIYWG